MNHELVIANACLVILLAGYLGWMLGKSKATWFPMLAFTGTAALMIGSLLRLIVDNL